MNNVARNTTVCGKRNAENHQKTIRSKKAKSRKVLGLKICSVWSKAKPSKDRYFGT